MFDKRIGIIGGGQLARMMVMEANRLGLKTIVYCSDSNEPAAKISSYILDSNIYSANSDIFDKLKLNEFILATDVITYEFENINLKIAEYIENSHKTHLYPNSRALRISQNRELENFLLLDLKIPVADFIVYEDYEGIINDLDKIKSKIGTPLRIKTSRFGYDGKGQLIISEAIDLQTKANEIKSLFKYQGFQQKVIIEKEIKIINEISVIVARNIKGQIYTLAPTLTFHENSILKTTQTPYVNSQKVVNQANKIAAKIATELKIIGIIAIEMFITDENQVVVNEISPRPHNSGHWSLNANCVNQFELLIRAITDLEFPDQTELPNNCEGIFYEMVNLLGKDILNIEKYLKMPNAFIYNYHKDKILAGRKMGHVNILRTNTMK